MVVKSVQQSGEKHEIFSASDVKRLFQDNKNNRIIFNISER